MNATTHRAMGSRLALLLACSLCWAGECGTTGRELIVLDMLGQGVEPGPQEIDGWQVTLDVADVAFGPLYLCATAAASSELCPNAIAEKREATLIDALDPEPQALGSVVAITGSVRSAMYNYGSVWPLTEVAPLRLPEAPSGHSARFSGRAVQGDRAFQFEAAVDVLPQVDSFRGRTSTQHTLTPDTQQLIVRIDPYAWWRRVDFDALAAIEEDGLVTIAPDASSMEAQQAHDALVHGMSGGRPPSFTWQ